MYVPLRKTNILKSYTEKKLEKRLEKKIWFLICICLFIKYCEMNNINSQLLL